MKKTKTDTLRKTTNLTEQLGALDDCTLLHTAWTPLGWTQKSIYKTGESAYFTTEKSRLFHDPEETSIRTISRLEAIRLAIQMNAPDEALEELGIELVKNGMVSEELHTEHRDTHLISIRFNFTRNRYSSSDDLHYTDTLWRNCDGRFFRSKELFCMFLRYLRENNVVLTQREAIAFALENRTMPKNLKVLGITGVAD